MSLSEKTYSQRYFPTCNRQFLLKIARIIKTCESSRNLMIGIYLIEKKHFLYFNGAFTAMVGDNYNNLMKDGWDFWFSLTHPKEQEILKDQVANFFAFPCTQDLLTLRYHFTNYCDKILCVKHEILLHRLEGHLLAINYLFDVSEKEKIEHCFDSITDLDNTQPSKENALKISAREKEVLQLVGEGFSSKQIADMLFISNHTAISHRKNLIEKFQVRNTAHLIKKASKLIPSF